MAFRFESLETFHLALDFVAAAYDKTKKFPTQEKFDLTSQTCRAANSVALNIAEGSARRGTRDYQKFLDTAWGSLAEVQTALTMANHLGYLEPTSFAKLEALATETSKTLFGLLRKISLAADRPKSR